MKRRKKTKVTLMLLWEEYIAENPDGYAYMQFRVHYNRYRQKLNPSIRQVHIGGEKMFVDYSGLTMPIYYAKTGEVSKTQIFVAVLGASGYTFVHATPSQTQEDFIYSHVLAYHFFGGTPRIVVPDNLKSAIISNNKKGIVVNESYADLARHYGMASNRHVLSNRRTKPRPNRVCRGYSATFWPDCAIKSSMMSMNSMMPSLHCWMTRTTRSSNTCSKAVSRCSNPWISPISIHCRRMVTFTSSLKLHGSIRTIISP